MHLKITKAGLLDTVQDSGRYGFQHLGINPGGAMDRFSASLANALLGKELTAPVIELHFPAAQFLFQQKAVICLAGADFSPVINEEDVPVHQPLAVSKDSLLSFKAKRKGARCYLSLLNEWHIEPWLNSCSTNLKAAVGGFSGRRLQRDDEIPFGHLTFKLEQPFALLPWRYSLPESGSNEVEFVPGPEWSWLNTKTQTVFLNGAFTVSPSLDRMGYRLVGEALEQERTEQLLSSAVSFGTVQLLPNGQLIVLMVDHQTTGGYPRIANVIRAHLPRLAQMSSGSEFQFAMTTVEEAEEKFLAQQKYLQDVQITCKLKIQNWLHHHNEKQNSHDSRE